jgi:carbohydrate-selective porin OprB
MKRATTFPKTALLALALMAAALIPALVAQDKAPDAALFLGDWGGTIDIGGMQLRIAVHFKLDDQKALAGTIDSLDQGAMGLPLAGIKVEGRTITFWIDGIPGEPTFKAILDESGKKMAGTFSQAGNEGAVQLAKAEK